MGTSSAFFDSLAAIISDPIYIGCSSDDLDQELRTNTWLISCSQEEAQQLTPDDFIEFFEQVIQNRRQQIQAADLGHSMLFYLWYDEQAVQLRFSLISEFHTHLPFRASLNMVSSMVSIIEEFLISHRHDGVPWRELDVEDFDSRSLAVHSADDFKPIVNVYTLKL